MHVQRLTHVRARSGWFDFAIRRSMTYPPSCPPKPLLNFPRKCYWLARKKRKKTDAWGHRHGKRWLPNHAGIGQPEDSCRPQARTLTGMQVTVAWRGHCFPADVCSSSRHRHCAGPELAGGRERSLALVAKVAVMQLCSYDESPTRRFSAMSLFRRFSAMSLSRCIAVSTGK